MLKQVKSIEKLLKQIEDNEKKILLQKELRKCEKCGNICESKSKFCPKCREKI